MNDAMLAEIKAGNYRDLVKRYSVNTIGQRYDQSGHRSSTLRSELWLGFGISAVIFAHAVFGDLQFVAGIAFLPMAVCAIWLLVRWNNARKARAEQLEILAWFKERGLPFPYTDDSEIIDPMEAVDWRSAQLRLRTEQMATEKATRAAEFKRWSEDPETIASLKRSGQDMLDKAARAIKPETRQWLLEDLIKKPETYGVTQAQIDNVMGNERFLYLNWEGRPAVVRAGYAWTIVTEGGDWERVNAAEVIDSGRSIGDAMQFDDVFPRALDKLLIS